VGGVISGQTFNNPEPSTHDVRDIFVGFQVQSSVTNTKVTLKLSQSSVIHNEVFFNFPDFSYLLLHGFTSVSFDFGDGTPTLNVTPNLRISHTYPTTSAQYPLSISVSPHQTLYQWGSKILNINQTNPVSGGTFVPPSYVKHITTGATFTPPVAGAYPGGNGNSYNTNAIGGLDAYIQYAPAHNGKLLKPLIFVDGIDFNETVYTWDGEVIRHGSTGWDIFQGSIMISSCCVSL
jgi:hypothetical protein